MSLCCGSFCLLVLLAVVVASGCPVHQFIDDNMKQIHESIADMLELRQPEIGSNPLFSSVIRSINTSCQRREDVLLMNATLNVYMHIFSSILQHQNKDHSPSLLQQLSNTKRSTVASNLQKLKEKMEHLRIHLSHLGCNKEDVLSKLNALKVDDPMVQRQALAQFKEIYQAASVIGSRCRGHALSS